MNRPIPLVTSIMDLNDDCLREVFEQMDMDKEELCEVAETSERFRSVAQEIFRISKFRTVHGWKHDLRTIRNFGEYVESVKLYHEPGRCHDEIYKYVGRYCGQTLKTMNLCGLHISDENAYKLQPALRNLHDLRLYITEASKIMENLHSWSPELLKLKLTTPQARHQPGLRQNFPKLEEIEFESICIDDIEAFLRLNPQLQRLSCQNKEDSIFRLAATHVPRIEHLGAHGFDLPKHMTFLNQLRSLKSLDLHCDFNMGPPSFEPAIDSLEDITLLQFDFHDMGTELTRLQNLQELALNFATNLTATRIIAVLVGCSQLSRLQLIGCYDLLLSADNLLDILRYGRALNWFKYTPDESLEREREGDGIIINAELYLRMVSLANSRAVKGLKMEIISPEERHYFNAIPDALLAEHQDELHLIIIQRIH